MATMKDIAKLAGVSTSTVSHVINQTRFVSEDIAKRVKEAAKSLNYAPSALARSLKLNRTQTIGMLLTTSTNPFFGEVVKGVERACYHNGYNLILCNTEGCEKRMQSSIETLLQRRVDGMILMCPSLKDEHFVIFQRYPALPVVVMDLGPMKFASDKIQDNSLTGGFLATQHLIENGHRKIGCITGPLDHYQAKMRYLGFQNALVEAKIEINFDWVIESDFEIQGGYHAFEKLLEQKDLPSALFVCNDMMAIGILHAANEKKVLIPEQLSIIGYDDIQLAQFMSPALTTIHQPKYRLGKAAVDIILDRLRTEKKELSSIQLEPSLVERQTVIPNTITC